MERTCISPSKHTENLHKVTPFWASLSSRYLLAHSYPATSIGSSHPILATKCVFHWPRVKMYTRQELCTDPKASLSLLNFLAIAIPHLAKSPGVGAKLEASSLSTRPICSSVKAELNGSSLYCSVAWMAALLPPLGQENPWVAPKREVNS